MNMDMPIDKEDSSEGTQNHEREIKARNFDALNQEGIQNHEKTKTRDLAHPRIPDNYKGYAMCTAKPSPLIVRDFPYADAPRSKVKPSWKYGKSAWVKQVVRDDRDPSSDRRFAQLEGWGSHGKYGYADTRYITPGYPALTTTDLKNLVKMDITDLRRTEIVCNSPDEAKATAKILNAIDKASVHKEDTSLRDNILKVIETHPVVGQIISVLDLILSLFTFKLGGDTPGSFLAQGSRIKYYLD